MEERTIEVTIDGHTATLTFYTATPIAVGVDFSNDFNNDFK